MAEEKGKKDEAGKLVEHKNIFAALAAFQGECPEIKKTKQFGKDGDKMKFMYAPLDEFIAVVSPVTSKHGLSYTWEEGKEKGTIVCALYHTTYEAEPQIELETEEYTAEGDRREKTARRSETRVWEKNVLRSMPIKVKREGDMKTIGGDSTYARRYTLAEVLGVASEDDNDIGQEQARTGKLETFAFTKAKEAIQKATTAEELAKYATSFEKDLKAIEEKKTPSLGLKKDQYEDLIQLVVARRTAIERGLPTAPGTKVEADADAQGDAPVEQGQQTIE
jgi:hypothetical protein